MKKSGFGILLLVVGLVVYSSGVFFLALEYDQNRFEPTWEELEEEVIREVKLYNYYLYERNREEQYPKLGEQLDMLYHDIKNGNLNNGDWIKTIETVKENNPKPTYPKPV